MADHHVQGSFAFTCTAAESALIEEGWQHAADLLGDFTPGEPSAEFLAAFMPTDLGNPFNGLLAIFDDPAFPDFGAEIQIEGDADCVISIYGTADFPPGPIAELIRHCCQESLTARPIGFDWSYGCSRPPSRQLRGRMVRDIRRSCRVRNHAGATGATTGHIRTHANAGPARSMDRRPRPPIR